MQDLGVMLITGGARGIGAATARLAAAAGYRVAINYRARDDAASALVAEIEGHGGHAIALRGDVAVEADVADLFSQVDELWGAPSALVNSAGINGNASSVAEYRGDVLERLFAVNVIGTMLCSREAARRMSTDHAGSGGAIVNVSSMAATIGGRAGASDYAASKAAVDAFTVGFAKEVAQQGIRVNAVRPAMTRTDMIAERLEQPEVLADVAATIPMARVGEAVEIAQAILWLLSPAASYISGARLDASGGGFMIGQPLAN